MERVLTVAEFAQATGLDKAKVYNLCYRNILDYKKIGRRIAIFADQVEEYRVLPKANGHHPDQVVIHTRHEGALKWLEQRGIKGQVLKRNIHPDELAGKTVYAGHVLPYWMAHKAERVILIEMPHMPYAWRGLDLTPEQMDESGARLVHYRVEKLS